MSFLLLFLTKNGNINRSPSICLGLKGDIKFKIHHLMLPKIDISEILENS